MRQRVRLEEDLREEQAGVEALTRQLGAYQKQLVDVRNGIVASNEPPPPPPPPPAPPAEPEPKKKKKGKGKGGKKGAKGRDKSPKKKR